MSDVRQTLGDLTTRAPAAFDGSEVMEAFSEIDGQSYKAQLGTAAARDADNLPALRSAVADTGSVTCEHLRVNVASSTCTASGIRSANVASRDCTASGVFSANMASDGCTVSGTNSANVASQTCTASGGFFAVNIGAQRVENGTQRSLAMGYAASGDADTANRQIHLFGNGGNIQIAGTLTSSHTFTDFAEMFANHEPTEIPAGTILTHDGGGVKIAQDGDDIAGVVSHTAAVLAGDSPFCWQGRYLHDEFGRRIYEDIADPDYEGGGDAPMISVQKENPEWDPTQEQVPRSERPDEWTPVGLLGQVYVRVNDAVVSGDKVKAGAGGIGKKSTTKTGLRCMTITQSYDAGLGYAVARCMINVAV